MQATSRVDQIAGPRQQEMLISKESSILVKTKTQTYFPPPIDQPLEVAHWPREKITVYADRCSSIPGCCLIVGPLRMLASGVACCGATILRCCADGEKIDYVKNRASDECCRGSSEFFGYNLCCNVQKEGQEAGVLSDLMAFGDTIFPTPWGRVVYAQGSNHKVYS